KYTSLGITMALHTRLDADEKKSFPKDVQKRLQKFNTHYGNKAANLNELKHFIAGLPTSLKDKVQVPEICPLSDEAIQDYLNQHAPGWKALWDKFVEAHGKANYLHPLVIPYLSELQQLIKDTFKKNPFPHNEHFAKEIKEKNSDLMVRSTGKEDDIIAANPGGNESVSAVKPDVASISEAMGIVVASYFSEKSL